MLQALSKEAVSHTFALRSWPSWNRNRIKYCGFQMERHRNFTPHLMSLWNLREDVYFYYEIQSESVHLTCNLHNSNISPQIAMSLQMMITYYSHYNRDVLYHREIDLFTLVFNTWMLYFPFISSSILLNPLWICRTTRSLHQLTEDFLLKWR